MPPAPLLTLTRTTLRTAYPLGNAVSRIYLALRARHGLRSASPTAARPPPPPPQAARLRCTAAAAAMDAAAQPAAAPQEDFSADFDKEQFRQMLAVKALRVPTRECHRYMKALTPHLLNRARLRSVADVEGDDAWKLLLLREGLEPEAFGDVLLAPAAAAAPAPAAAADARPRTLQDFIAAEGLEVTEGLVQLDYGHATAAEALRVLLPPGSEIPSAFEAVGHVAHVNLRPEVLPYRRLIAAVLLDKNPRVKTVVNKLGNIDSEWRVFEMEVIGGRDDTVAEVRQHGERFRLDFRRVYWNSRLEAEHRRLVEEHVRAGEVVLDVMAGVGPFAVPAARRGARVLANDLNPDSHKWLVENVRINGVGAAVSTYCVDGRQLMRQAAAGELRVEAPPPPPAAAQNKKSKRPGAAGAEDAVGPSPAAEQQQQQQGGKGKKAAEKPALAQAVAGPAPAFDHAIMNLPATAVEFLDAFRGAFAPALWAGRRLPWVHVYAFLRADQTTADLRARIEAALGGPLEEEPRFHSVRDVAPNKQMYCASFRVPAAVAFAAGQEGGAGGGPKRQRVD